MSIYLTLSCDGEFRYGLCPKTISTTITDPIAAEIWVADKAGWALNAGKHRCPDCAKAGR